MQEVKTYYYQDGNAVRKTEVEARPYRTALPNRKIREQELREEKLRKERLTERRRKYELRKNKILTGYMILAVALFCIMLVSYVSLQNSITTKMNHIAELQTQISEIKTDNNATESRIATSTNLEEIKDRAINELGMVYATSSQIVYYSVDGSDYMSQYHDIP